MSSQDQPQPQPEDPRSYPSPELQLHSVQQQQPQPQPPPPLPQAQQPPGRNWFFNVAFAGPSRVGKTKLIQRFADSNFSDGYAETVDTTSVSKAVSIGRHHVLFQCWDTPGADTLTDGLDQRVKFPHALFILFDVSRDASAELERWCRLVDACGPPRPLLVLVGNKSDLGVHSETLVTARQLRQLDSGLLFVLSVLADDENVEVDAMMLEVGKVLTERHSLPLLTAPVGPFGEAAAAGESAEKRKAKRGLDQLDGSPGEGPSGWLKEFAAMLSCCRCCPCCY